MGFHEKVDAVVEGAIASMTALGADIIDIAIDSVSRLHEFEMTVLLYEFKHGLNAYLAHLQPSFPRSLAEIIEFNERQQEQVMPYFAQELMVRAQAKGALTEGEYRHALEQCAILARAEGIDKALRDYQLDALIAPTAGPAWMIDVINGDRLSGSSDSSSLAAVAGYPSISVPAGFVEGLPVGLSFFAGAYQEARLIQFAHAFEQASKVRRPPSFAQHLV
jgi:amidase